MQLLYINELEKRTKLDEHYKKQRRGLLVTHHWDEELTEAQVNQVMDRIKKETQFLRPSR